MAFPRMLSAMVVGAIVIGSATVSHATSFEARCLEQFHAVEAQMPLQVDMAANCHCQANALRRQGYDPETFYDGIDQQFSRLQPNDTEQPPDKKTKTEVITNYVKVMQASGAAFAECVRGDVQAAVDKGIAELKQQQKALPSTGANKQGAVP